MRSFLRFALEPKDAQCQAIWQIILQKCVLGVKNPKILELKNPREFFKLQIERSLDKTFPQFFKDLPFLFPSGFQAGSHMHTC